MLRLARHITPLAVLLVLASCSETTGPPIEGMEGFPQLLGSIVGVPTSDAEVVHLRHSPWAPALETYQLSFWAHKGEAKTVEVHYQNGEWDDGSWEPDDDYDHYVRPFIRLHIPAEGLAVDPSGDKIGKKDSVLITVQIDSSDFNVTFGPSGLRFSDKAPASIEMWYHHADDDLNRDGVVDSYDWSLRQSLSYWYRAQDVSPWYLVISANDSYDEWIKTLLYHFSGYAVSWDDDD